MLNAGCMAVPIEYSSADFIDSYIIFVRLVEKHLNINEFTKNKRHEE